jgi:hypothetical protein
MTMKHTGTPEAAEAGMNYYEQLVAKAQESMEAHPRSAIVLDSKSFEVIATCSDIKKLTGKLRNGKLPQTAVVFQRPSKKAVWILGQYDNE